MLAPVTPRHAWRLKVPRPPDFIVGGADAHYLHRWWVIPRNALFNVYLHHFLHSDDDRALHDHPYANLSILLSGSYLEHMPGGVVKLRKAWRPWAPWRLVFRRPTAAHRIELRRYYGVMGLGGTLGSREAPVWTLFITGPRVREWGFLCPSGWRHWKDFTNADDGGSTIGRGCE